MSEFNCYARIDKTGERFLLGDVSGRLFMLLLVKDRDLTREGALEIKDLKVRFKGFVNQSLIRIDDFRSNCSGKFRPLNVWSTWITQVIFSGPLSVKDC